MVSGFLLFVVFLISPLGAPPKEGGGRVLLNAEVKRG